MKKLLLAIALCLISTGAFAQCNGAFADKTVCGNNSGSAAPPYAVPLSSISIDIGNLSGWGSNVEAAAANALNGSGGLLGYSIIGTSGATVPLLNGANTWSNAQTMPTLYGGSAAGSSLTLQATSSVTPDGDEIVLKSSLTAFEPSGSSGTLASITSSQFYIGVPTLSAGALPSFTGTDQAGIGASTTNGGMFGGQGSTYDSALVNQSGAVAIGVPTGTVNVAFGGDVTAGTWQGSDIGLGFGGTNASLTASNGGIVYSTSSALAILAGNSTAGLCLLSGANAAPTWGSCSGEAAVAAVANSDGTLTISPTTGSVVASLNLANPNTWTAPQTFNYSGAAAPPSLNYANQASLQVVGQSSTPNGSIQLNGYNGYNGHFGGDVILATAAGNPGSAAVMQSGDGIGFIQFFGYSGVSGSNGGYAQGAQLICQALELWTTTANGTSCKFYVTPDGSTGGGTLALTIGEDQSLTAVGPVEASNLSIASGKTLTDTSAIGADLLLGATGGGFTAYGGTSCTDQALTALNAAGVATCASVTNALLSSGTFANVTGTGTLTAGTAGTGFTIAGVTMTLGSDATGDLYYRNSSGVLTRLAEVDGDCVVGSGGLPAYGSCGTSSGYTVSTLPSAQPEGARAFVTDQSVACPATGAALTGGGSVVCPVFYNNSAWVGG